MKWLFFLAMINFIACGQQVRTNKSLELVKVDTSQDFRTYQNTSFRLVKDTIKLNPWNYDISLEGKGQFSRVDSSIHIIGLKPEQLKFTIQEKGKTKNAQTFMLHPKPNPHKTEKWAKMGPKETPGFTSGEANRVFLNYFTYQLLDQPVPEFKTKTVSGKPVSEKSFQGQVTLINFWFYGCRGCMLEIPALNKLKAEYKNDDQVQFLAFFEDRIKKDSTGQNLYESQIIGGDIPKMAPISASPFNDDNAFTFPQVPNATNIIKLFNIKPFPTTMIIDEEGVIRYIKLGMRKTADYPEALTNRLKSKIEQVREE